MVIFYIFGRLEYSSFSIVLQTKRSFIVNAPSVRKQCPFYGMSHPIMVGHLLDSEGNQCALITSSHSPCKMEMAGQAPDWDKCGFLNHDGNSSGVAALVQKGTAYPNELCPIPEGGGERAGMPIKEWFPHVMGRPYP